MMVIVNWRQVVQGRDGWKGAAREAPIPLGLWSHRRRILMRILVFNPSVTQGMKFQLLPWKEFLYIYSNIKSIQDRRCAEADSI
jgi:hypothetical protein